MGYIALLTAADKMSKRKEGLPTVVEHLERSELVLNLLHSKRQLPHQLSSCETRSLQAPGGVEGLLRGLNGEVDIFGSSFGYFGVCLTVG